MSQLSNSTYAYYIENFSDLEPKTQFHFASRLYLWNQDVRCKQFLADLRPWFTENDDPLTALKKVADEALISSVHGSKNASELRKPYFEMYPMLKSYVSVLFRMLFLKSIYNTDTTSYFYELFKKEDVDILVNNIQRDHEAVSILSTHAVNFIYLYNYLVLGGTESIDVNAFLTIGKSKYEINNPIHLQLLIYLYTHCIIGDSLFYSRSIPEYRATLYREMLGELEELIDKFYLAINLDNKFEFLVCNQLCNIKSSLEERIYAEAAESKSDNGTFLVDKLNRNPQSNNLSLDKSEHRNVLFIMANEKFSPLG